MTASSSATKPMDLDTLLRRYATQATAALSVVVGVTGVMMFFHLAKAEVEAMHEWLGLGFTAVALGHAVRHRHSLVPMLRQTRMRLLLGAAAVAAAAFVVLAPPKTGNPFRQTTQVVLQAPLKDVAPLVGVSPDDLAARLNATDASQSIEAIARARGTDPVALLGIALKK